MDLGEKIRDQRRKAGLSQEQLAEKLNVSRQTIDRSESSPVLFGDKGRGCCYTVFYYFFLFLIKSITSAIIIPTIAPIAPVAM